jgi:uncharacterized delta-60 repeat protein
LLYLTTYQGTPRQGLARLNTNGSLDTSFVQTGTGFADPGNGGVFLLGIALQADRKMVVSGGMSNYNGIPTSNLARVNSDGTLDTSFNIGAGLDNYASSVFVQSDQKIIVGGWFKYFNSISHPGMVRLNSDGSVDNTFDIGSGCSSLTNLVTQPDAKILILGVPGHYFNASTISGLHRITVNGESD